MFTCASVHRRIARLIKVRENDLVQAAGSQARHKLSRAAYQKAHGDWDQLLKVSTAADIIRQAGYPLEEHEVVSQDGYITRMERMPNKGTHLQS